MVNLWQGYYRRADANLGLGKVRNALNDFRRAAKVNARDPDLRKKLEQCEREVKRLRFEDALSTPVRLRRMCCTQQTCAWAFGVWRMTSRRRGAVQAGFERLRF